MYHLHNPVRETERTRHTREGVAVMHTVVTRERERERERGRKGSHGFGLCCYFTCTHTLCDKEEREARDAYKSRKC